MTVRFAGSRLTLPQLQLDIGSQPEAQPAQGSHPLHSLSKVLVSGMCRAPLHLPPWKHVIVMFHTMTDHESCLKECQNMFDHTIDL